jgi:hypothetical protein
VADLHPANFIASEKLDCSKKVKKENCWTETSQHRKNYAA